MICLPHQNASPLKHILYLALVSLVLPALACQGSTAPAGQPPPRSSLQPLVSAAPGSAGWYEVYFTRPDDPRAGSLRGGPDKALAEAIDNARASIDLAVLELDLWSIRDALRSAHKRGVKVRMVIETEYRDAPEVQDLIDVGIRVVDDRRDGLMHNKFVVIDRQDVWTGSMNFSTNDGYRNNNNLIHIRSKDLAADYTAEFEEMFTDYQFGPGSPANTPQAEVNVDGTRIEVCFAPDDGCAARVIAALQSARQSIHFLAYSFTSDDLARPIFERAQAGVTVMGVMEAGQAASNSGTEFQNFRQAGLDVRKDGNPRNMHDKVMIIDGQIVVTGSYNFTYYGENRNDENLLIIYNPQIAALYQAEFDKIFAAAK